MTAAPDTRVPPLPAGTLCTYRGAVVRAYFRAWDETLDERYDVYPFGERKASARVTRGELEACRG